MHLHPDQTWKWPFYDYEFPVDTLPSYHQYHTPRMRVDAINKQSSILKKCISCSSTFLVTYIEHAELWPTDLFLPGTSTWGPTVVFADFTLALTSICRLTTIAHLLPWSGIWVDTAFGEGKPESILSKAAFMNINILQSIWFQDQTLPKTVCNK